MLLERDPIGGRGFSRVCRVCARVYPTPGTETHQPSTTFKQSRIDASAAARLSHAENLEEPRVQPTRRASSSDAGLSFVPQKELCAQEHKLPSVHVDAAMRSSAGRGA